MTLKNKSNATITSVALSHSGNYDVGVGSGDAGARTDDTALLWDDYSGIDASQSFPGVGVKMTALSFGTLHGRRGPIQLDRPSWYPRAMGGRVNRNASPEWKKLRHACGVRTRQHQRREVQDRQVRHRAPLKEHKRVDPCPLPKYLSLSARTT